MPELSVIHIVLLAFMAAIGAIAGWVLRGNRAEQEKAAVSAGWQDQIDAQRRECDRLQDQNKSLMEQVSQGQAQHNDAKNRAKELSSAIQEAFAKRDELQREIKEIRSSLEKSLSEREQLVSDAETRSVDEDVLREKDARIEKLRQELEGWASRVPPLVERYRVRNEEAERLEADLAAANERIRELEEASHDDAQTRIEPVRDPEELTDGLDASNDAEDPVDEHDEDDDWSDDEPSTEDSAVLAAVVAAELESEPHTDRDDLKRIKGVGPAIEKTLNEMGIVSLRQIAEMGEYDIDRIAKRLKGFHTRIYREDWIGQARALIDQAAHA